MSILVRAALLGGLAYVVSRAVRNNSSSSSLSQSSGNYLLDSDDDQDQTWPAVEQRSTSNM